MKNIEIAFFIFAALVLSWQMFTIYTLKYPHKFPNYRKRMQRPTRNRFSVVIWTLMFSLTFAGFYPLMLFLDYSVTIEGGDRVILTIMYIISFPISLLFIIKFFYHLYRYFILGKWPDQKKLDEDYKSWEKLDFHKKIETKL